MELSDTFNRDAAARLAPTDRAQAAEYARQIGHPWFKCQALSYVAFHTPQREERDALIAEAFSLADSLGEPNRIVCVSAWPLKVAAQHWADSELQREVDRLLAVIAAEPSPVRRADGLRHMIDALVRRPTMLPAVLEMFIAACFSPLASGQRNRRGESWFIQALPIVACYDYERASDLCGKVGSTEKRSEGFRILSKARGLTFNDLPEAANLPK